MITRFATFAVSVCIVAGLTACCCPMRINVPVPRPIVFDPPPVFVPPPNTEPVDPSDPLAIVDVKIEPPEIYAKDARFAFLDLSTKGNRGRLQGTFYPDNHLGELPLGAQTLADVPFRVQDRYLLLEKVNRVSNIGVGSRIRRLHVCHAAQFYGGGNTPIAFFVLRFTDNTRASFPVIYGRDMVNWWLAANDPLPESKVAWRGSNAPAKRGSYQVLLYLSTFENPHPDKTVHTIDYVRGIGGGAIPFCVAMTVEKE